MLPSLEQLLCRSPFLNSSLLVESSLSLVTASAIVPACLSRCAWRAFLVVRRALTSARLAGWLSGRHDLCEGGFSCSIFPLSFPSSRSACLLSALHSSFLWLRVGWGEVAVTRSFLDSLSFWRPLVCSLHYHNHRHPLSLPPKIFTHLAHGESIQR